MKERPILFKGAMVRAILDDRKTQTRRIVKNPLRFGEPVFNDKTKESVFDDFKGTEYASLAAFARHACQYGRPGDRLWVRETFATGPADHYWGGVIYQATHGASMKQTCEGFTSWKPSIHMPRSASRIDLEIVSVRVERLQDITEEDAKAEGVDYWVTGHGPVSVTEIQCDPGYWGQGSYKTGYWDLWESINGPGSWDANPYVWVVEFKRVKP